MGWQGGGFFIYILYTRSSKTIGNQGLSILSIYDRSGPPQLPSVLSLPPIFSPKEPKFCVFHFLAVRNCFSLSDSAESESPLFKGDSVIASRNSDFLLTKFSKLLDFSFLFPLCFSKAIDISLNFLLYFSFDFPVYFPFSFILSYPFYFPLQISFNTEFIGVQVEVAFKILKKVVDCIIDSGTRSHVAVSRTFLIPETIYTDFTRVEVVGGRKLDILERGSIQLLNTGEDLHVPVILKDALPIPGGDTNLVSMSRFDELDYKILLEKGLMVFINPKTGKCDLSAKLRKDGLYHVCPLPKTFDLQKAFGVNSRVLNVKSNPLIPPTRTNTYISKRSDEVEVPESVLLALANLLDVLGLSPSKSGKEVWIWDPFVCTGRSARFWKSRGYRVLHNSDRDFHDPYGPKPGQYDILITCGPFSETKSLFDRLSFEPKFVVLCMTDSIARKMFKLWDCQLIFNQCGIKFVKTDGTVYPAPHPSSFTWVSKGLNLPTTNTWLDCTGKIQNFSVYNSGNFLTACVHKMGIFYPMWI